MRSITRFSKVSSIVLALAFLAGCQQLALKRQQNAAAKDAGTPPAVQQAAQGQAANNQQQLLPVDFRLAQEQQDKGLQELKFQDGTKVWYLPDPVLSRADLATAEPRRTKDGRPFVRFTFNQVGAQKLASISDRFPGKYLVLTLGNSLVSVYQMQKPITNGILDIGFANDQEAISIVNRIAGQS
ncbi:hypothetical protein [Castellaniella sp.]|uniref:SecDF P1 head subdomain-containing protein n=1 Tax=Castellaniella sp. TaxID=1955812 RepID=UPI00355E116E